MNNFKVALCDTDSIFFQKQDGSEFNKEEIADLNSSLNSLFPEGIKWEVNGLFEKAAIIRSKNYVLEENGKLKIKGSALRSPHKEPKFQKFIQQTIQLLLDNHVDQLIPLYNRYVKDILYLTDISEYCSKKTITKSVLNPTRSNEQNILDAIKGEERVQEGDKIFTYFDYFGNVTLRERWNNDHDVYKLLKKLYMVTETFERVVNLEFIDYTLQKNQQLLFDMILNDPTTIPSRDQVYRPFSYFKPKQCKCIIIGESPLDGADGLAFSTSLLKPSQDVYSLLKVYDKDLGHLPPQTLNLEPWAQQGVLLINNVLTAKSGIENPHRNMGWEQYTTTKINEYLRFKQPIVIMAWGKMAQAKLKELKIHENCLVLVQKEQCFSISNEWLVSKGVDPIDWKL